MKPEQQQEIFDLAEKMLANDLEWMDVLPVETKLRPAFQKLLQLPQFTELCMEVLGEMRRRASSPEFRAHYGEQFGHQEPVLEAAGLVQAATNVVTASILGSNRPDIVEAMQYCWIIKVRQIEQPLRQGRPGQWVPKLADQQAAITAGRSPL